MSLRVLGAVSILWFFGASQGGRLDVSTRAVVRAAAAYVAEYERQLTFIVAEEHYTQEVLRRVPAQRSLPRWRRLEGEVFFMFAPAGSDWMAIRDVMEVDGKPVGNRPDLQEALRTLPARDVAATFKAHNSRFNIGRTFRNFNEPTLSLLALDDNHRPRFSFDVKHVDRSGDAVLVTLAFTERKTPTLIFDLKRGRVFSTGEFVVEAATGRIRRAALRGIVKELRFELTTIYAPNPRLGIWVPATFREQYEFGAPPADSPDFDTPTEYENVLCDAAYSNFRRFETSARIK